MRSVRDASLRDQPAPEIDTARLACHSVSSKEGGWVALGRRLSVTRLGVLLLLVSTACGRTGLVDFPPLSGGGAGGGVGG
ncbi:MAG: hypothetical protein AB1938_28155, partial [Myxococcota bacterium]